MLKNCRLQNFKSVYDPITLPLAPLTIFAGANSSGKSTLIQSLLLTAQTVQNAVRSRSIVLNGHILRLGEFDDVLSSGSDASAITVGFSLHVPQGAGFARRLRYVGPGSEVGSVECEFSFSARATADDDTGLRRLQPYLEKCSLSVSPSATDQPPIELSVSRSQATVSTRLDQLRVTRESLPGPQLSSLEYEVSLSSGLNQLRNYYPLPRSSRPVGASLQHFIPASLTVVYDVVEHEADRIIQLLTASTSSDLYNYWPSLGEQVEDVPADILTRLQPVLLRAVKEYADEAQPRLPALGGRPSPRSKIDELETDFSIGNIVALMRSLPVRDRRLLVSRFAELENAIRIAVRGNRPPQFDLATVPLPPTVEAGVEATTQFFTRYVRYLGPLRDEPKPVYPLIGGADPKDIGYRGEHTAAVLETYRNAFVSYHPPVHDLGLSSGEPHVATLHDAVLAWLQYMGIAEDVRTADLGKLGHELKVAAGSGDEVHDLTHVGVGVSQVLPILVLALLAEPGSTLIFEQPELHLHPRVQTRLADFFVSLSRLGKQCLVETHSEYLINRLRFLAATAADESVSDATLLYFVERQRGHSRYRPIRINTFGVIEDWPIGFFDENEELAASILQAGADKRRRTTKRPLHD